MRTQDVQLIQDATINALSELAETRAQETGSHIWRPKEYVRIMAECLQAHPRFSDFLTEIVIKLLDKSASLHDIGKVGIPDYNFAQAGKADR